LKWRLLREAATDPAANLAVEEAIVRSRRDDRCVDTLRVWRNNRSVILGCHSNVRDEVDLEVCDRMGIKILRRISGGGAVYHDLGNVNYSIIMKERSRICHDVLEAYRECSTAVLRALTLLGISGEFVEPNAIFSCGKKIAGMAQHRFYDVLLVHGTLLVNSDLGALSKVLLRPRHEVTNISVHLPRCVPEENVEDAIIAGFRETFKADLDFGELSPYETEIAHKLAAMKYRAENWNTGIDRMLRIEDISNLDVV